MLVGVGTLSNEDGVVVVFGMVGREGYGKYQVKPQRETKTQTIFYSLSLGFGFCDLKFENL